MPGPANTRLRFVNSKSPETIVQWVNNLGARIMVYNVVFDGKSWFVWYVPGDDRADIPGGNLD